MKKMQTLKTSKMLIASVAIIILGTVLFAREPKNYGDWDMDKKVTVYEGKITVPNVKLKDGDYFSWVIWECDNNYDSRIMIILEDWFKDVSSVKIDFGSTNESPLCNIFERDDVRLKYSPQHYYYRSPIIVTFSDNIITKIEVDMPRWKAYSDYWAEHGNVSLLTHY